MEYRKFGNTGKMVSALGFGCMRFPVINKDPGNIDEVQSARLLHHAIEQGINYFDTAWFYHGGNSESFVGKTIHGRLRQKIFLATKLPPTEVHSYDDMDRILNEQLRRLQTDYLDFYLLHALNKRYWNHLKNLNVIGFLEKAVKDGRIHHIGFSFHDDHKTFMEIIDSYAWEFCQIQYNYMDTDHQAGQAGLDHTANKGIGAIIMEPLRGGKLATDLPQEAVELLKSHSPNRSPAAWALRFLWNQPQISIVLSGMSSIEQMNENIETAQKTKINDMSDAENNLLERVAELFLQRTRINCTNCGYCMPCPSGVSIPNCFEYYNKAYIYNDIPAENFRYQLGLNDAERASQCIRCGSCEPKCPQQIPIMDELAKVAELFEK